ncbi:PH domain-containing protein [Nesterenkonia rhizosphaerae]|uniref:PH domain-containing protein n=1 Tax=Nesterenkonia rhizosphaerae TaxID=1348272 RepID=A0ABP9G3V5_9MICC
MSAVAEQAAGRQEVPSSVSTTTAWQRLSARIIWADLAISVLSVLPAAAAIVFFDGDTTGGQLWPLIGLAVVGVVGAIFDVMRWTYTRFRITETFVELKTGVIWRQHRSIQRDRIRSVDTAAKLRHRLARMRVVNIGAGQQAATGESALSLDALSAADALALQNELHKDAALPGDTSETTSDDGHQSPAAQHCNEPVRVLARFEPSWFIYNMFNIWAYVLALGLGWGSLWLVSSVGFDLYGFLARLLDWESIGLAGSVLIAVVGVGAFGAVGLGVLYFTENWNLELARVSGRDGTMLRTRKGLFTRREIIRDESRIRGAQISQPVLWRWMGASDTSVITTGLDQWAASDPAAIIPRGPRKRAQAVAGAVLGATENPFELDLHSHPCRALWRRLWWATLFAVVIGAALTVLAVTGVIPYQAIWGVLIVWPLCLLAALVAYRALGHKINENYVIMRSGLLNRATTVLERSAVSTIVIRESVLQRWLKLRTVSAMTAAGDGGYDAPDMDRLDSLQFALEAAPGLLDPFVAASHGLADEHGLSATKAGASPS